MKERNLLGHIDCPTCGTTKGMRITEDKNGDPFGYCEANCGQQLRIGGDKRRVRDFFQRYPGMQRREHEPQQTAPAQPTQQKEPEPIQETAPKAKAKAEPRSAMADALRMLGAM